MLHYINELKKIGLNSTDAKVYLALIALGNGVAIDIAKKANIPRTSVYDSLPRLTELGLIIISYKDNGNKLYRAQPPGELFRVPEMQKKILSGLVPVLTDIYNQRKDELALEVLPFKIALKKWHKIVLNSPGCGILRNIGDPVIKRNEQSQDVVDYRQKRTKKAIRTKIIGSKQILSEETQKEFNPEESAKKMRTIKYLPSVNSFKFSFKSFNDYMYIRLTGNEDFRLIIKSASFSKTYNNIFRLLWKQAVDLPRKL